MERAKTPKRTSKLAQWFRDPGGRAPALKPNPKAVQGTYGKSSMEPVGGRGGKKEAPHRIDELHLRGSAGRREVHASSGSRKNALPYRGNRAKNPK